VEISQLEPGGRCTSTGLRPRRGTVTEATPFWSDLRVKEPSIWALDEPCRTGSIRTVAPKPGVSALADEHRSALPKKLVRRAMILGRREHIGLLPMDEV
jgi:hypothetical protein